MMDADAEMSKRFYANGIIQTDHHKLHLPSIHISVH